MNKCRQTKIKPFYRSFKIRFSRYSWRCQEVSIHLRLIPLEFKRQQMSHGGIRIINAAKKTHWAPICDTRIKLRSKKKHRHRKLLQQMPTRLNFMKPLRLAAPLACLYINNGAGACMASRARPSPVLIGLQLSSEVYHTCAHATCNLDAAPVCRFKPLESENKSAHLQKAAIGRVFLSWNSSALIYPLIN